MKHVTERYGEPANDLTLTRDEYFNVIDPFLLALGIRSRVCLMWSENGQEMVMIQAENLYQGFIKGHEKSFVDGLMTPDAIARYKM